MTHFDRIPRLFDDFFEGEPWTGVNITETLEEITADQSFEKISVGRNSIWEIVNHMTLWRQHVLQD